MGRLDELPYEVCRRILQCLGGAAVSYEKATWSLMQACTVADFLLQPARSVLYRRVDLEYRPSVSARRRNPCWEFARTLQENCGLGRHVRMLDVSTPTATEQDSRAFVELLATVLALCPNVQDIHFAVQTVPYQHRGMYASLWKACPALSAVTLINGSFADLALLPCSTLEKVTLQYAPGASMEPLPANWHLKQSGKTCMAFARLYLEPSEHQLLRQNLLKLRPPSKLIFHVCSFGSEAMDIFMEWASPALTELEITGHEAPQEIYRLPRLPFLQRLDVRYTKVIFERFP